MPDSLLDITLTVYAEAVREALSDGTTANWTAKLAAARAAIAKAEGRPNA
jgi:hypothetical protein